MSGSGGLFDLYEIVPGFLLCTLAAIGVSLAEEPDPEVVRGYDRALAADRDLFATQPAE